MFKKCLISKSNELLIEKIKRYWKRAHQKWSSIGDRQVFDWFFGVFSPSIAPSMLPMHKRVRLSHELILKFVVTFRFIRETNERLLKNGKFQANDSQASVRAQSGLTQASLHYQFGFQWRKNQWIWCDAESDISCDAKGCKANGETAREEIAGMTAVSAVFAVVVVAELAKHYTSWILKLGTETVSTGFTPIEMRWNARRALRVADIARRGYECHQMPPNPDSGG